MTPQVERRAVPSLLGGQRRAPQPGAGRTPSLIDLLHDGFFLLFLLKNGATPPTEDTLMDRVTVLLADFDGEARKLRLPGAVLLADFDGEARKLRLPGDDIAAAKYAYCAALDEIVLGSGLPMRDSWERRPLQLAMLGDQLAGENFFERLEELRSKGGARLLALQVFHLCLLLGYRGRHAFDASEKLNYLSARLGDEIAHIKGKSRGFAPQAERPDQIVHKLRGDVPLWALSAAFGLIALGAYAGLKSTLTRDTQNQLASYVDLVKLAPRPANVTITLP